MGAPGAVEELIVEFDQTSEKKHLGLAPSWDGIPSRKSLGWDGTEFESVGELTGKMESGTNSPPSNESSHGNTSVLDLRMTVPCKGLLRSHLGELKWIPDTSEFNSVGGLHDIILANLKRRGRGGALGRSKSSSGGGGGNESDNSRKLHFVDYYLLENEDELMIPLPSKARENRKNRLRIVDVADAMRKHKICLQGGILFSENRKRGQKKSDSSLLKISQIKNKFHSDRVLHKFQVMRANANGRKS
jgi:hypothetical protein